MKMADLAKIVDDLSALTVLEAAELSKLLEEKCAVSAAAAVAAAPDAVGAAAPAADEQEEFDVILHGDGGQKNNVRKEDHARHARHSGKPKATRAGAPRARAKT